MTVTAMRLARLEGGEFARFRRTFGNRLGLIAGCGALEFLAGILDVANACRAVDGGTVTEVGVDAGEELAVGGLDVLDDNMALGLVLAVSAGTVELAEVRDLEAVNGDGSGAVVLDDLVLGANGTTASDGGVTVILQSESI